jgi:hypothetical protein
MALSRKYIPVQAQVRDSIGDSLDNVNLHVVSSHAKLYMIVLIFLLSMSTVIGYY